MIGHFQRLDEETRRFRFGHTVGDAFLTDYVETIFPLASANYGAFPDDELRGIAELRELPESMPKSAEVALAVEADWQDRGIGDALFNHLIAAAQNRGIKKLHMICLHENARMRNLVKKHDADLAIERGDVEATLALPWPTPLSIFQEMFGNPKNYLLATFNVTK
ncbi:MAG: GNAT family N-acetyltransferase [Pseudomonadota bacterium]